MDATILPFRNRMPDDEFDRRWKAIVDTYGTTTKEAIAKRDLAIAMLLIDSGWDQDEIAARIGRSTAWVSNQLIFADFLSVYKVNQTNLAEFHFRKLWHQTKHLAGSVNRRMRTIDHETTPARYAEVARLLKEEANGVSANRKFYGKQVVEKFADGQWHRSDKMAEELGISEDDLLQSTDAMRRVHAGAYGARAEMKMVGRGRMYRVFRQTRQISTAEMREKLKPYLDELKGEGKKDHIALASFKNVLRLAILIERQIDSWEQGE